MDMKRQYIAPKTSLRVMSRTFLLAGSTDINVTDTDADNDIPMLSPIWEEE